MEEKGIVDVCRLLEELLRPPFEESVYDREVGTMERQRNYMDPK
jgi:hypothetical protein